jgi:hypothetical protein
VGWALGVRHTIELPSKCDFASGAFPQVKSITN